MLFEAQLGSLRRRTHRFLSQLAQHRITPLDTGPVVASPTSRVSVIVPVYNAMPYLRELLASLAAQDLPRNQFDIVFIDDGSTDGSGATLERFTDSHSNARLIRQRNSGWPGQPRNLGIEATRGDYVFFADADDVLAPHALRCMLEFAQQHDVDVLLPRMAGLTGRRVNRALYASTLVDAPLRTVFASLSPQKLIRRQLLDDHGLRFAEGRVRLEDGMLVTACYLLARRVSILADEDYYFLRSRSDGQNISARRSDPRHYTDSVSTIAGLITSGCTDPALSDQLVMDLYQRKILRSYLPARFESMSQLRRRATLDAHAGFIKKYLPLRLEEQLGYPYRQRSELARRGDVAGLLRLGEVERLLAEEWKLGSGAHQPERIEFDGPATEVDSACLVLRGREDGSQSTHQLERIGTRFGLPLHRLDRSRLTGQVHDAYLQPTHRGITGTPRRLKASEEHAQAHRGTGFYATRNGYLSLDARNTAG